MINPVYGMTEAAFFGKFRSMLRKQWSYSKPYRDALSRAKVPFKGEGRRKFSMKCEACGDEYALNERVVTGQTKAGKDKDSLAYVVHHIEEAGQLNSFGDMSTFAEKLFCPLDGLQILCYNCHREVHK